MGENGNISIWMILARLGGLLVLLPATVLAEESSVGALEKVEAPGLIAAAPTERAPSSTATDRLPLTRAAAQQRIEAMTPVGWLASYGDVVVGRDAERAPAPTR